MKSNSLVKYVEKIVIFGYNCINLSKSIFGTIFMFVRCINLYTYFETTASSPASNLVCCLCLCVSDQSKLPLAQYSCVAWILTAANVYVYLAVLLPLHRNGIYHLTLHRICIVTAILEKSIRTKQQKQK